MGEREPLDIFLSYARHDGADLVARLHADLAQASIRFEPWYDQLKAPDEAFDRAIERALSTADVMLVVLTEASPDRDWCRNEIAWAQHNDIPIVVAQMHPDVEPQLALIRKSPLDFAADYDAAWARLVDYLAAMAEPETRVTGNGDARPRAPEPATPARANRSMRFINEMPQVPVTTFHDHVVTMKRLDAKLRSPAVRLVLLSGHGGIGKTAMLAEIRRRLADGDFRAPAAGFVYLAGRGYRRISAAALLGDLGQVVPDPDAEVRLGRRLLEPRPWRERLNDVLATLGSTPAVVAIDDVDDLLDEGGRLRDRELGEVIAELVRREGHRVRLLMTGRRMSEALDRDHRPHVWVCRLDEGLPFEETAPFLRGLDSAGVLTEAELPEADLRRLSVISGGNPRFLELTYALLAADRGRTLHVLLHEIAPGAGTGRAAAETALLWRIVGRLKRTQRRIVQALAIYGRPVEPRAVDHLLHGFVADPDSGPILERLAERRLVRRDGHRFFLPPEPDAARIRDTVPPGRDDDWRERKLRFVRPVLLLRAADFYRDEAERTAPVTGPDELDNQFSEIELRIAAGGYRRALEVMEAVDRQYLTKWGQSDALLPWRRKLVGRIGDSHLEAHNLSFLVAARDEEDHTGSWTDALTHAVRERWVGRTPRDRTRLRIQLADIDYDNGRLNRAARRYRTAGWRCEMLTMPYEEAMARTGRGIALARTGSFHRARREFGFARWLAAAVKADDDRREVLAITLLNEGWALGQLDQTTRAMAKLADGMRLASDLGSAVLTGQLLDGRAALLCDHRNADEAIPLAEEAAEIGVRTANGSLSREANVTLALAYLLARDVPNALAAARAAVQRTPSMRALGAWAVYGVGLYRAGRTAEARSAFHHACTEALLRLDRAPAEYAAHDAVALALVGLELCGEPHRLPRAIDAYARARRIARAPGASRRSAGQLELFGPEANPLVIEAATRAARGDLGTARMIMP